MIRWKNWKLWGLVFLFFIGVWFWRLTSVNYYMAAPIETQPPAAPAPSEGEMMKKSEEPPGPLAPGPSAAIPVKEPTDVWGWVVKGGVVLSGLKTLLDIVDKLKKHTPQKV